MNLRQAIADSIEKSGVAILPPMDVKDSMELLIENGVKAKTSILDPWYNKGIGGVLPDAEYDEKCHTY